LQVKYVTVDECKTKFFLTARKIFFYQGKKIILRLEKNVLSVSRKFFSASRDIFCAYAFSTGSSLYAIALAGGLEVNFNCKDESTTVKIRK